MEGSPMPRRTALLRRCLAPMLVIAAFLGPLQTLRAGAADLPQGPSVPFKTVIAGTTSHITEPTTVVVRDRDAWIALWRRHTGRASGAPPPVDFSRDMVVAVFGGTSTEVTAAGIARITREPGGLVVWYSVHATRPLPPGELGTLRSPFHIVKLARSTLPVAFSFLKTQEILRQSP
jgi:hypothetical protein